MSKAPDFEFALGHERFVRGRGWLGVLALTIFLTALLLALWLGVSRTNGNTHGGVVRWSAIV